MHILCNAINVGYIGNLSIVSINFKKKYISLLDWLVLYNYIGSYTIKNRKIYINLRYFRNKGLIFLKVISTGSNKKYYNNKKIIGKNYKNNFFNLNLYTTNLFGITNFESIYKSKIGGKHLICVYLLYKNIIF